MKIGRATCLHMLHDDLHPEEFNLRHVPGSLEVDQKAAAG
jgi:hypothetical protein